VKTIRSQFPLLLLFAVLLISGCASYMHGYTQDAALDRYLLVDESTNSFGYQRMKYATGYHGTLEGFVAENGFPDFIYEYETPQGHDAIRLYYAKQNTAYIYECSSWSPSSLYLKKQRRLSAYEKATYKELLREAGK